MLAGDIGRNCRRSWNEVLYGHATSEIALGGKRGIGATKKLLGGGFTCPWPPLIRMDRTL